MVWDIAARALCVTSVVVLSGAALAEDGPVKIDVLADMSGVYADIGGQGSVEAVKMAIEDSGGSMLGKPIEVVSADGQNKPDISANIARNWYDSGVDAITDLPSSGMALGGDAIVERQEEDRAGKPAGIGACGGNVVTAGIMASSAQATLGRPSAISAALIWNAIHHHMACSAVNRMSGISTS